MKNVALLFLLTACGQAAAEPPALKTTKKEAPSLEHKIARPIPVAALRTVPTVDCTQLAAQMVKNAQKLPMPQRAPQLLNAIAQAPEVGCGTVTVEHWNQALNLPQGCTRENLYRCPVDGGLELAERLKADAEPALLWRVQTAVAALRQNQQLSPSHQRLFETILLSSALSREKAP